MMNRFIFLIAFSIFVAEGMNNIAPYVVNGMLNLTRMEQVTSGLNDTWMLIWMSALNSQLYQNPQGVFYIALVYLMATATKTARTAWSRTAGNLFNRFLASLHALCHMGWFGNFSIIVVALYSLVYFVDPFAAYFAAFSVPVALQNLITIIMLVASVFVNAIMYILGWLRLRRHSNIQNFIFPLNWAYIFIFSFYAMGILYSTNVIDMPTIKTSLYTYGALTMGNQLAVKMQPTRARKERVMNLFNKCYEKAVNKAVYLLPVGGFLVALASQVCYNYIMSDTTVY